MSVHVRISDVVSPTDHRPVDAMMKVVASRAVDSYRARRHFLRGDGTEVATTIWVRVGTFGGHRIAVVGIEARDSAFASAVTAKVVAVRSPSSSPDL